MTRGAVALCAVLAWARLAGADPEADADRAFRAASTRAMHGDAGAIDAFEAIAKARPVTRWTDDAWSEVARLAERGGDFARARAAYTEIVALGCCGRVLDRARGALARLLAARTWDEVTRAHQRGLTDVYDGGDPHAPLETLEALARAHPAYPRRVDLALAIARGWELEGEPARGLAWYRLAMEAAPGNELQRAGLARARAQIRAGALDDAGSTLDAVAARPNPDRAAIADVRATLAARVTRVQVRWVMWSLLGALALATVVAFVRATGSWRAALQRLVRPPVEAVYLSPIVLVLVVVAQTGNPLVGGAVTAIACGGFAITWTSGSLLEAWRARTRRHVLAHALCASVAAAAVVYLAVEPHIDFIAETWAHGPDR